MSTFLLHLEELLRPGEEKLPIFAAETWRGGTERLGGEELLRLGGGGTERLGGEELLRLGGKELL